MEINSGLSANHILYYALLPSFGMASSGPPSENNIPSADLYSTLENTDFFRSLVENGSDAIVSIDEDSEIIYANRSVERIFGYTPTEMVGQDLTMIMPERFHDAHFNALSRYIKTDERSLDWNDIELPAEHKDGHEITLSITFEEHDYEGERIFSGIMRDISERKSHEENLLTIQEMAQNLMHITDRKTIAEDVVSAAVDTLGFPVVSIFFYDESSDTLKPVAHSDAVQDVLTEVPDLGQGSLAWKAFHDGELQQYITDSNEDTPVFKPDGPICSEYIFPLNDHGCLLVSTTNDRELSDRQYTLAQILAASAESALKRAQREAEREQQRERLERFASIVSHDLRDPINTARATLAVARAGDTEAFDELDELFDRMDELIEDVLVLAKQGRTVGSTETVDIQDVVDSAWATVETDTATLNIEKLSTVSADPERLRTLFENLFRNAIEHAGSTVTVSVGELENQPGFYIEDDGPGFENTDVNQLFEYGYTTEQSNTGFGLNIVSEIVEAHEWSIKATSGSDGGARFEIMTEV